MARDVIRKVSIRELLIEADYSDYSMDDMCNILCMLGVEYEVVEDDLDHYLEKNLSPSEILNAVNKADWEMVGEITLKDVAESHFNAMVYQCNGGGLIIIKELGLVC